MTEHDKREKKGNSIENVISFDPDIGLNRNRCVVTVKICWNPFFQEDFLNVISLSFVLMNGITENKLLFIENGIHTQLAGHFAGCIL